MGKIRKKCIHYKLKWHCAICNPKAFCEHGKRRYQCPKCKGAGFCKHGTLRYYCKKCEGGGICEHGKQRRQCEICDPDSYLAQKIRTAVYGAFQRQGEVKDEHTLKLLGVDSWQQFRTYWQAKLNYWNQNNPDDPITMETAATDHIKPVHAFKDLPHGNPNHHTNLQPISVHLNGQKSDKWQQIDEDFWKINIYKNPKFICTYLPYEMSPGLANSFFGLETTAS